MIPGPSSDGNEVPPDFLLPVRKSSGISSRRCLDLVAQRLRRRDLGHAGTLDPFAEGLLLLLGGRATRLVPWIQSWDKEYLGRIRLGVATDSLDGTGAVVATAPVPELAPADLAGAARGLTGTLLQAPPMYSAAHVGGERLYELARQGLEVERPQREREVSAFEILSVALPDVDVRVVCSSGTYIRVLAESFGRALGLPAHLCALERRRIGPWSLDHALTDDVAASMRPAEFEPYFVPLAQVLADWPQITIPESLVGAIRNGRLPADWAGEALPVDRPVRLTTPGGLLAALAEVRGGSAPRLLRVFDSSSGPPVRAAERPPRRVPRP